MAKKVKRTFHRLDFFDYASDKRIKTYNCCTAKMFSWTEQNKWSELFAHLVLTLNRRVFLESCHFRCALHQLAHFRLVIASARVLLLLAGGFFSSECLVEIAVRVRESATRVEKRCGVCFFARASICCVCARICQFIHMTFDTAATRLFFLCSSTFFVIRLARAPFHLLFVNKTAGFCLVCV